MGFIHQNNYNMKLRKLLIISLLIVAITALCIAHPGKNIVSEYREQNKKYSLEDLAFDLNSSLSPSNHLWVMSGWSTVNPVTNTVMGVGDCMGPPLAGWDFRISMTVEANGHPAKDTGSAGKGDVGLLYSVGKWILDKVITNGQHLFLFN